jgi:lipoic acid synthetase
VEVLTGDFLGERDAVAAVIDAAPEIMSHNIETVRRLTRQVRSRSDYDRSLEVLRMSRELNPDIVTKSSIMLGLGETREDVAATMDDLRGVDVGLLNIGQYLQPSRTHLPVQRYWLPEEFAELRELALQKGFVHCDAGPLVRSSYHADEGYEEYRRKIHPLYRDE